MRQEISTSGGFHRPVRAAEERGRQGEARADRADPMDHIPASDLPIHAQQFVGLAHCDHFPDALSANEHT